MAERDHSYPVKRGGHIYRGRRPGHNRIYQHLGVRDLREIIDRKRNERGFVNDSSASEDPSYSCLKDNADDDNHNSPKQINTRKLKSNNQITYQRRDREIQEGPTRSNKDIESPLNIKVEFSTSTGEHVYKIDENTVLPKIKHVPDHTPSNYRPFRGRGRGRGRGHQNYQGRTYRSTNKYVSENKEQGSRETPPVIGSSRDNWDEELNTAQEVTGKQSEDYVPDDNSQYTEDNEFLNNAEDYLPTNSDEKLETQLENLNINENESLQTNSEEELETKVENLNTNENESLPKPDDGTVESTSDKTNMLQ